jgi:hypothetical protein
MRKFPETFVQKSKRHNLLSANVSTNRGAYDIIQKKMIQPDKPQMTMQYGACALHAG